MNNSTNAPRRTYNGYANYETWAVSLWIDNEQYTQALWAERTQEVWELAGEDSNDAGLTQTDWARIRLSDELKEWAETEAPDLGASLWADLLNAALSEVNWPEIADNMLASREES